jgi:hypothetical protein
MNEAILLPPFKKKKSERTKLFPFQCIIIVIPKFDFEKIKFDELKKASLVK